ncbi:ArnT family glycosyltransferase [Christiangramia fulva]|uniref:ArnT family glycosyltransferase n=1 Tax=Christiangramia fulva TaxID=2126553 RepID=UPI00131B3FF7|nr:glycosyltransferase family 39 protein [Christiangramia fulva]
MKTRFYSFLLLIFVIVTVGLGSWGLTESSEARYAEISREMVKTGDYLHPRLLDIQHFHKPPLTYYITALGYNIFGINEFGARFFLQVSLIIQLLLVFKLAMLLFKNEKIAFSSAAIYFTFPIVLIASRNLTTDSYLATTILGCIYAYAVYKIKSKTFYLYLCYFLMGLGFLNKGPVIILPVLAFTIPWKVILKDKWKFSIHHLLGFLLFLLVSASWFILIIREIPELWNYFIQKHTVDRALSAETFHRDKPFWYFIVLAPLVGLPWFIYTIILSVKKYKPTPETERKFIKILLWSSGIVFLMFSAFSSKLVLYILPIFPLLAVVGGFFLSESSQRLKKNFNITYYVLFVLFILALILLKLIGQIQLDVISIIAIVVIAVLGLVLSIKFSTSARSKLLALGVAFTTCVIAAFAFVGDQNPYLINTTRDLAAELENGELENAENIMVYDYMIPSTAFYLDRPIITVHEGNFNTNREVQFEQDSEYKKTYLNVNKPEDLRRFTDYLQGDKNVLIMRRKGNLPDSLQHYLSKYKVEEAGKWKIYY